MDTSKRLIKALEKADWLDRMLIISAFIFFLLVVLFILQQRVINRGIRIAFWWTRFLPDFSADKSLLDLANVAPTISTVSGAVVLSSTLSSSIVAATLSPPVAIMSTPSSSSVVATLSSSSTFTAEPYSSVYAIVDSSLLTSATSTNAASSTVPTHVEL